MQLDLCFTLGVGGRLHGIHLVCELAPLGPELILVVVVPLDDGLLDLAEELRQAVAAEDHKHDLHKEEHHDHEDHHVDRLELLAELVRLAADEDRLGEVNQDVRLANDEHRQAEEAHQREDVPPRNVAAAAAAWTARASLLQQQPGMVRGLLHAHPPPAADRCVWVALQSVQFVRSTIEGWCARLQLPRRRGRAKACRAGISACAACYALGRWAAGPALSRSEPPAA